MSNLIKLHHDFAMLMIALENMAFQELQSPVAQDLFKSDPVSLLEYVLELYKKKKRGEL